MTEFILIALINFLLIVDLELREQRESARGYHQ